MNQSELHAIREREKNATPGPWRVLEPDPHKGRIQWDVADADECIVGCWWDHGKANAEFIAHARTDIPALLAAVDALRAGKDECERQFQARTDEFGAVLGEVARLRALLAEATTDLADIDYALNECYGSVDVGSATARLL